MEAAVRWSPHSIGDRRRFLLVDVAESRLALNEIDGDLDGNDKVRYNTVSSYRHLPSFSAFSWSPTNEAIVALGHASGNASLINISDSGLTSTGPVATYKTRQQRRCNSIAFNTQNWLAVALDKTRSDVCLNVYDAGGDNVEPIRRLCPAELVSSVRFFSSRPQEVVATTQRSFIKLYDLRGKFVLLF